MAAYAIGRAAAARPKHPALLVFAAPRPDPRRKCGRSPISRMPCCASPAGCAPRACAGRAHSDPAGEHERLCAAVLRRHRRRLRAAADIEPAHRARGAVPAAGQRRRGDRARPRPADAQPAGRRAGVRRRRHRAHAARGPARRLRRHRRGTSGLPHLYVRHDGGAQGRAARTALRLRAAADVSGLVRHRARRPHAACRRLQLDIHARQRAHRPVGQRRHGDHLHRREGSGAVAAAHRADRRDAVRRRAGRLPPDAEIRQPVARRSGRPAPRADGRRNAAAGALR